MAVVVSSQPRSGQSKSGSRRLAWRRNLEGYLFISPVILGLMLWVLGPAVSAFYLSLTNYDLLTTPVFEGLRNYTRLVHDPIFWQAVRVSVTYSVVTLPISMIIGLALALLLNQKLKGIALFRTVFYIPSIVPAVATALLWAWLLNPQFGLINNILAALHLPQGTWLSEPNTALPSLMLMGFWGLGGGMVIYLAGLQGVPEEYYEAAKIDGANRFAQFWHVTIPMISPTLFYQLVLGLIASLQYFTQAFVLSGGSTLGAPQNSTLFLTLYIYEAAFDWTQMGYACAMAVVLFALILLLTLVVFGTSRFWVYYAGSEQ